MFTNLIGGYIYLYMQIFYFVYFVYIDNVWVNIHINHIYLKFHQTKKYQNWIIHLTKILQQQKCSNPSCASMWIRFDKNQSKEKKNNRKFPRNVLRPHPPPKPKWIQLIPETDKDSSVDQQHKQTNKQPADVLKPGLQWDMDQIHNTYKTFLTTKWWGAGRMEKITHDINSISLIKSLFDSNKERYSLCATIFL